MQRYIHEPDYYTQPAESMEQLLDQAAALAHDGDRTEAERKAAAVTLLRQTPLVPGTMEELFRLHHLWLQLDELDNPQLPVYGEKLACAKQANAVLQQHRETILQAVYQQQFLDPQFLHTHYRIIFALMDADSLGRFDPAAAAALFAPLAQHIRSVPHDRAHFYVGDHMLPMDFWGNWQRFLLRLAPAQSALCPLAVQAVDWQCEQFAASKLVQEHPYHHQSAYSLSKAEIYMAFGHTEEAEHHITEAITCLQSAPLRPYENDFLSWMTWTNRIEQFSPAHALSFLQTGLDWLAAHETPQPDTQVAILRKIQVAQKRAWLYHLQGQHETALHWMAEGWFCRVHGAMLGEVNGARYLHCLMQLERIEQAAPVALHGVLHETYQPWQVAAAELALQQLDRDPDPARRITWACMLAWLQIGDKTVGPWPARLPDPHQAQLPPIAECLHRAREAADLLAIPNPPLLALVTGMQRALQKQWAEALPHLEHAVAALPEHANQDIVFHLVMARLLTLPLDQALARPFPASHQADWCYRLFRIFGEKLEESIKEKIDTAHQQRLPPLDTLQSRLRPLAWRYGEEGLARFAAFFASGQGHYYDAQADHYAYLCSELALAYRLHGGNIDRAIALLHQSQAMSPWPERYRELADCILDRAQQKGAPDRRDHEEFVAAIDACWPSDDQRNSYQKNQACAYFVRVAQALDALGRYDEIPLWLARLYDWFDAYYDGRQRHDPAIIRVENEFLKILRTLLATLSKAPREQAQAHLLAQLQTLQTLQDRANGETNHGKAENPYHAAALIAQTILRKCHKPRWRFWRR